MSPSDHDALLKPVRIAPVFDEAPPGVQGERRDRVGRAVVQFVTPVGVALFCLVLQLSTGSRLPLGLIGLPYLLGLTLCAALLGPASTALATALSVLLAAAHFHDAPQATRFAVEGAALIVVSLRLQAARARAAAADAANLRLERQVLEVSDDERRRIGHDLHDGLGQQLTGIALLTESVAQQIEAGQTPPRDELETITRLTTESVSWTKDLARSLSPTVLENEGLLPALEELASNAAALFDIECVCHFSGPEFTMEPTRALHVYRIAQESISNSAKHGKARRVDLNVANANGKLRITVIDDGSGLSGKTIRQPGMGLRIMRYRARIVGAEITVRRAGDEGGTVVECTCPIDAG